MSKAPTLLFITLILSFSLTQAARPHSVDKQDFMAKAENFGEICYGVGEEECLMRRTLIAHTDYIYTQNHKP